MRVYPFLGLLIFVFASSLHAEPPALLVKAVNLWAEGRQDLAFTQRTRTLNEDQSTQYERVERYDPSLPDAQRWRLLEVNGRPPTEAERRDIEDKRNRKPRKRAGNPPASYLDLTNARQVGETDQLARFEVGIKPEVSRLVALDKLVIKIAVDKASGSITHISAALREPMRVAFGLAKVIDVDLDVQFEEPADGPPPAGEVSADSTARVKLSKFGNPQEFSWSDFKEVPVYNGGK
ncbi:MAG: hypothetical protein ACAH89_02850 [Rariglobus sp.]|nr:hypothetical protein [Rariglobus sp.]